MIWFLFFSNFNYLCWMRTWNFYGISSACLYSKNCIFWLKYFLKLKKSFQCSFRGLFLFFVLVRGVLSGFIYSVRLHFFQLILLKFTEKLFFLGLFHFSKTATSITDTASRSSTLAGTSENEIISFWNICSAKSLNLPISRIPFGHVSSLNKTDVIL